MGEMGDLDEVGEVVDVGEVGEVGDMDEEIEVGDVGGDSTSGGGGGALRGVNGRALQSGVREGGEGKFAVIERERVGRGFGVTDIERERVGRTGDTDIVE